MEDERRSIRMSYLFPVLAACAFMAFDGWGIFKGCGAHAIQYFNEAEKMTFVELINCFMDLFIGYIPATVFSLVCFAIAQQRFFGVAAGLEDSSNRIFLTYIVTIVYGIIYAIYLVSGNVIFDKILMIVFTLAFYGFIWFFAITKEIRSNDNIPEKSIYNISGKND